MAKRKTLIQTATDKLNEDEFDALTMHYYDEGLQKGIKDGIAVMASTVSAWSGKAFQEGRDEAAKTLRECAEELTKRFVK